MGGTGSGGLEDCRGTERFQDGPDGTRDCEADLSRHEAAPLDARDPTILKEDLPLEHVAFHMGSPVGVDGGLLLVTW